MVHKRAVLAGAAVVTAELAMGQLPPAYEDVAGRERLIMATAKSTPAVSDVREADPPKAREWVQFPAGRSSVDLSGELDGAQAREFHVVMRRFQTMAVTVEADGVPTRFSVRRKGATLFEGQAAPRHDWTGTLPATDDYVVRLELPADAVRRGERAKFQVRVAVIGQR
jgi:hypothetical protein